MLAGLARPELHAQADDEPIADVDFPMGSWIWTAKPQERQSCRFWRAFDIPGHSKIVAARARITADNNHYLYLDGRHLGQGGGGHYLTEYNLTLLLQPGRHVFALKAFSEQKTGGVLFGLHVQYADGSTMTLGSDAEWREVKDPGKNERGWFHLKDVPADWPRAVVVDDTHRSFKPRGLSILPPTEPTPPLPFWQSSAFQIASAIVSGLAVLACFWLAGRLAFQTRADRLMQRERERIARDLHDDFGAKLTQLVLQGEVVQTKLPPESDILPELQRWTDRARGLRGALDEVVWAVNSRRDTVRDTIHYLGKHATSYFEGTPLRCRLDIPMELPPGPIDLATRRNLLFAVKEALSNVLRHSTADEVFLRVRCDGDWLMVHVEDNGGGYHHAPGQSERQGLGNMAARMKEVSGRFALANTPAGGCRVEFSVPLTRRAKIAARGLKRRPVSSGALESSTAVSPRRVGRLGDQPTI